MSYLSLFSINLLRTVVRGDKNGFIMTLKLFNKLFNIVFVSAWFENIGNGSWLPVALAYVL